MSIKDSQIFHINSRNRISGSDSNFLYVVNTDDDVDYSRVCVLSASIPKSYYLLKSTDYFILTENGSSTTVYMTAGNYSQRALATVLSGKLNSASVSIGHSYSYSITYSNVNTDAQTGKFTFSVSGNGGIQPVITFNTTCWEALGFAKNTAYQFSGNTLTSVNVCKLTNEDTIMIRSDIHDSSDDVLQAVYSSADQYFNIINFEGNLAHSKRFRESRQKVYRFQFTNEDNQEINFNGLNPQITLILYNTFEESNFKLNQQMTKYKAIKDELKNTN